MMQMPNLPQIAMQLLQQNQQIANSPQGQQLMQILQNGDVAAGEQMARNICASYGMTEQQMLMRALNFFNPKQR